MARQVTGWVVSAVVVAGLLTAGAVARPDFAGEKKLPKGDAPADARYSTRSPVFMPDGRIAYVRRQYDKLTVEFIGTDGSGRTPLKAGGLEIWHLAVSRDGKRLVGQVSADNKLVVMDVDGSGRHELPAEGLYNGNPTFSPDGRTIAWVRETESASELWVSAVDGTDAHRLADHATTEQAGPPSYSPDGRTIAFTRTQDEEQGDRTIWLVDADGRNLRQLTHGDGGDWGPAYSPDGRTITFVSTRAPESHAGVYVMAADGSDQRRLSPADFYEFEPSFSPDGTRIVFTSGRDGDNDVYVMNADGTNPVRVTRWDPADAQE